ncbi:MAG TPA: TIR domain-containing protein [Pyrinomonadaceae bacterium]|nr:TIR domain-containing protein [Pyrinomonadaceae bacterium]
MGSKVFISYSHADEKEKNALLLHLGVLRGAGLIDLWSDDRISGGSDWQKEIEAAMAEAQVAIFLITANFLTSEFILNKEVPILLEYGARKGLVTFPVIARDCPWKRVDWLAKMNVRPKNGIPVWSDGGAHADEYLTAIAYEIADIVSARMQANPPDDHAKTVSPVPDLRLYLMTRQSQRFETTVRANVQIAHLIAEFVHEWPATADPAFVQHRLKLKPDGPPLDNTLTLAEAGISDDMTLYLVEDIILPTSSVGLIVEDDAGHRFVTNVLLDTPVKRLAAEFMSNLGRSAGEPTVELLARAGVPNHRLLRGDSTLYDERVQNGAHLRVVAKS